MNSPGHMITSPVLLNRRDTFGTLFSICRNPVRSLRIILTLLQPLFDKCAGTGLMFGKSTPKAKIVATSTVDRRNYSVKLDWSYCAVHSVFAVGRWAPTKVGLIVYISPIQ